MSQIKQLLSLDGQGHSIKSIARHLGMSKNTVKSYPVKLAAGVLPVAELLALEDPDWKVNFTPVIRATKNPRFTHLSLHLDYFISELKGVGVTKKLLSEEK